jgi:Xaa-Pro aminopeptidase
MADPAADRLADIDAKHETLLALLREREREGLLLLEPANFSWLSAGATARGVLDPAEHPALYIQNSYRWLICSSVDTQRLFDEELDGLGFQVKEWPWSWGRRQLLADVCEGKRLLSDSPFADCLSVGDALMLMRRRLSELEQARLLDLGKDLAHALEATCRNCLRGETEEEVAGQLAHRLLHRGLEPILVEVSADERLRKYRRHRPSKAKVERNCVVRATARRHGLHATASRVMSFGPPDTPVRNELEVAVRWSSVLIAASTVGAKVNDAFIHGARYLEAAGFEHEWRLAPLGWVTGHAQQEIPFLPSEGQRSMEAGWAVVWNASVGAVANTDTVLVTALGPQLLTPAEAWPVKRIRVAGLSIDRPDILVRTD